VADGATVPIYYESRLIKVGINDEGRQLINELESDLSLEILNETQSITAKRTRLESLVGTKNRIDSLAKDIVDHYELRSQALTGKAMILTMTRSIAADLYKSIITIRPEWHSDELTQGTINVVMTAASSDGPEMARHHTSSSQRNTLSQRMKDPSDQLKLVIVCDMWLTGFDVPCLHTMYIDKPMQGHTLMQAIARVNRVFGDKPGGLIVDYIGIASELKKALSFYSESGGHGDLTLTQEQAVNILKEKIEIIEAMFHGFSYECYFTVDTSKKLSLILSAQEHILGLENGKKRYIDAVTAMSAAYALAIPHPEALILKDKVAFFQAIKARLVKLSENSDGTRQSNKEIELAVKQAIDQALITGDVINLYDASGIRKPDVSIFTDDFLNELRSMERKHTAIEILRKLLKDELKGKSRRNITQSKRLLEKLEETIRKYQNRIITAVEVIENMIEIAHDIKSSNLEAKELGLKEDEYSFYCAVADNKSARELMGNDKLREIATVLYQTVQEKATIDWTIKESVQAALRVAIRRILNRYGYPPDMAQLATENVIKQAEAIAEDLSK
jgi:type I restriction enzyme R subunit